jgi:4-amino-4-deoxy-L-arabinose transferase-like glycosyltransferase
MAVLAFFTKAAAAFYIGALGLAAIAGLIERRADKRAALYTLAGLAVALGVVAAVFVLPNWNEYRFYNWQMSVTRKPSYDLKSITDRVSWFPVLHDTFSRMWFEVSVGVIGAWGLLLRWRTAQMAERLLVLWLAVGTIELLVHDVGNERRLVFLIPALIAVTSVVLGQSAGLLPDEAARIPRPRVWLAAPLILYTAYVLVGPIARLPFLYIVKDSVRLSAVLALALGLVVVLTWPRPVRLLSRGGWRMQAAAGLTVAIMAADLVQFFQWASIRTSKNYEASRAIGRALPDGTLVHGKLANGLALENRIRPVFVGHGFGNFEDRRRRDDVRYILTYIEPSPGYEGSQIEDILDAYPHRRIIMTFDVAETPSGHDRAALIDKRARD